jgi:hypothetical protein
VYMYTLLTRAKSKMSIIGEHDSPSRNHAAGYGCGVANIRAEVQLRAVVRYRARNPAAKTHSLNVPDVVG